MRVPAIALAACVLVAAISLAGCAKPEPPELTVKQVKVSRIDLGGIEITVDVETFNPNSIELSARRVTGQVLVDGRYDLGTVTVEKPVVLPAHGKTNIETPLSLSWQSVTTLASIAVSNRPVPYTVKGTVNVGGDRLNIDMPFTTQGTFTAQELAQAAARSLPIVR
ncbi:MAG: LEA type 2 family protein [Polyangiaceae bacterium]|nr:LEA type 2 family protein [Polyangiaceae bacterium]